MKKVLPYIKRADELEQEEPLASFYCRTYAVEQLLGTTEPSLQSMVLEQLEKAEGLKSMRLPEDLIAAGGPQQFRDFCARVYASADEALAERDGEATELAMRFYFATLFYDVLTQFGALSDEDESKRVRARRLVLDIKRGVHNDDAYSHERQLLGEAMNLLTCNDKAAAVAKLRDALTRLTE